MRDLGRTRPTRRAQRSVDVAPFVSRRRLLPPLRSCSGRLFVVSRRVQHGVHTVPTGGKPRHAAGDLRVPNARRASHRPRPFQRFYVRRRDRARRSRPHVVRDSPTRRPRLPSPAACIRNGAPSSKRISPTTPSISSTSHSPRTAPTRTPLHSTSTTTRSQSSCRHRTSSA